MCNIRAYNILKKKNSDGSGSSKNSDQDMNQNTNDSHMSQEEYEELFNFGKEFKKSKSRMAHKFSHFGADVFSEVFLTTDIH